MDDLPGRSRSEGDAGPDGDGEATGGPRRRLAVIGGILLATIVIAVVVLIVFLHLTGTLGPGIH